MSSKNCMKFSEMLFHIFLYGIWFSFMSYHLGVILKHIYVSSFGITDQFSEVSSSFAKYEIATENCTETNLTASDLHITNLNSSVLNECVQLKNLYRKIGSASEPKLKSITQCVQTAGECADHNEELGHPEWYYYYINCTYKKLSTDCKNKLISEGYSNEGWNYREGSKPYRSGSRKNLSEETKNLCETTCQSNLERVESDIRSDPSVIMSCVSIKRNNVCDVKLIKVSLARIHYYFTVDNQNYSIGGSIHECKDTNPNCVSDFEKNNIRHEKIYYRFSQPCQHLSQLNTESYDDEMNIATEWIDMLFYGLLLYLIEFVLNYRSY